MSREGEETDMRKRWFWIIPVAIIAIPLFIFIGGEVVMHLWNWLLPPLFGWRALTFWQALGLLVLCRVLFGGLGGHGGPGPRRHWRGRCRNMSPEEREKFRRAMVEGYNFGTTGTEKAPL
jgi:hypothetical protein